MTSKPRKDDEERRVARERIFGEPDVRVQVTRTPDANDPDNYEIPEDDPDAGQG